METKVRFELTPLMMELFKTQATVLALVNTTMTDEQKQQFDTEYVSCLKNVIIDFTEANPSIIEDAEKLIHDLNSK